MSFISRKLGQREYLSLPFITVITQLCPIPLSGRVPPSGWKRDREEEGEDFFYFFFFFNFDSKSTYVPVVTTVNRFYIFATFNDLKLVVCAKLATGHGDFFVRKANQLRWKEFRRVALSLVFSIRSLLLLLTPPLLHSVFIQDERFDKTENLHDVNPSPPPLRVLW